MIKIAGNEGDGSDRLVTITGTPESVGLAQYLINSRYTIGAMKPTTSTVKNTRGVHGLAQISFLYGFLR